MGREFAVLAAPARDGSQSAREGRGGARRRIRPLALTSGVPRGAATQSFVQMAGRTTEVFAGGEDDALEDVRKTLFQVRQQFDVVHHEAEEKEARLRSVKEAIGAADRLHCQKGDHMAHLDEKRKAFELQYEETWKKIRETQTSRKVYEHMLARIQKEQAILRQKMLKMEDHLQRKRRDVHRRAADRGRANAQCEQSCRALDALAEDAEAEREACQYAQEVMQGEVRRRQAANMHKAKFDTWRHQVALAAANEAFNASAGRLRKIYAIEKLCGNHLQKVTFEQVERSQNTEDGFQKIREVTGLTDVMDIVHKFLNREVEHEQLKGSVKDAEVRLEALRQDFDDFKRDSEGITFDFSGDTEGAIYKTVEQKEKFLNEAMQEHEACRTRLQRTKVQAENMIHWANRVGQLLSHFEDPLDVKRPKDLNMFFNKLEGTIERFLERVGQQVSDGKITHRALMQAAARDLQLQDAVLKDPEFLRNNLRVQPSADGPARPASRSEDNPTSSSIDERETRKKESEDIVLRAQQEQQKRSRPRG